MTTCNHDKHVDNPLTCLVMACDDDMAALLLHPHLQFKSIFNPFMGPGEEGNERRKRAFCSLFRGSCCWKCCCSKLSHGSRKKQELNERGSIMTACLIFFKNFFTSIIFFKKMKK